jgi:hypothetical protein
MTRVGRLGWVIFFLIGLNVGTKCSITIYMRNANVVKQILIIKVFVDGKLLTDVGVSGQNGGKRQFL